MGWGRVGVGRVGQPTHLKCSSSWRARRRRSSSSSRPSHVNQFLTKHGHFPIRRGRFLIKHGNSPIKYGRFPPGARAVAIVVVPAAFTAPVNMWNVAQLLKEKRCDWLVGGAAEPKTTTWRGHGATHNAIFWLVAHCNKNHGERKTDCRLCSETLLLKLNPKAAGGTKPSLGGWHTVKKTNMGNRNGGSGVSD